MKNKKNNKSRKNTKINKKIKYLILPLILLLVTVFSVSYAVLTLELTGERNYSMTIGTLDFKIDSEENAIRLMNAYPMADTVGQTLTPYTFTITNTGTLPEYFKVSLVEDEELKATCSGCTFLSPDKLRYQVTIDGVVGDIGNLSSTTVLDIGQLTKGQVKNYELRIWVDSSATSEEENKYYYGRIKVEASQESFDTSCPVIAETEPNPPELTSGMIAVTYNETDKTWVKADTSTNDWYDYSNQIWANAVTVTEDTRDTYMALDAGEPISMDDINTMWVWIPRYSYTIMQPYGRSTQKCSDLEEITIDSPESCRDIEYPDDLRAEALAVCKYMDSSVTNEEDCIIVAQEFFGGITTFEDVIDRIILEGYASDTRVITNTYPDNYITDILQPGEIDINFINDTQKDTGTGKCETCIENWVTPECFAFGEEELPGFWMAKFEVSTKETCTAGYDDNEGCDLTTLTPQIKPNVTSWRSARVSTFFETSRLMQSADDNLTYNADTYGFDTVGNGTMDVHMLKNTEWGAVAYLSQSKYGKYGNLNYVGNDKEVAINNCTEFITGIAGDSVSAESSSTTCTTNTYETVKGQTASTTGNVYGVYDMNGGNYEYVMGNYDNISGSSSTSNSGFCGTNGPTENCRQWPELKYYDLYENDNSQSYYKFGDATYETRSWYNDVHSTNTTNIWFYRGGHNISTTRGGVFATFSHAAGDPYPTTGTRFTIKP